MQISSKDWDRYVKTLRALSDKAGRLMLDYLNAHDPFTPEGRRAAIEYAYALATTYGEATSALACEMYDAMAELSGAALPMAEPAPTATYGETAKAINGTLVEGLPMERCAQTVGRLVKQAGADTTLQNARRDRAEFAWIPQGESCAFCLTLGSRGWQRASKAALNGGHAEHIHANCDCQYSVRFDSSSNVAGYDPKKYLAMYKNAPLTQWNTPDGEPPAGDERAERSTPKNRINAMRRQQYKTDGAKLREQHRMNYAEVKAAEAAAAVE